MILTISCRSDLDKYLGVIAGAVERSAAAISAVSSPMEMFKQMKFEQIGFHPVEGHPLNLIEQLNQTFTYLVALHATAWLLDRHPDAGGFRLAPGAKAMLPFDIMSVEPDLLGAETFAAVHPDNNRKLAKDLAKIRECHCTFRYIFFYSPAFPPGRVEQLERHPGVEIHCIDIMRHT